MICPSCGADQNKVEVTINSMADLIGWTREGGSFMSCWKCRCDLLKKRRGHNNDTMGIIAKSVGVEIGEVFEVDHADGKYFFTESAFYSNVEGINLHAPNILYELLRGQLQIVRWPEVGDTYWYPDFMTDKGYSSTTFQDSRLDVFKNRVGRYKTEEEAKEKSRKLGWIK